MNLKHAVNEAIDECIHQDIMADFLRRNRAEVVKMSIYEYDEEKNYKMLQEQYWNMGHERGKSEGIVQGRAEGMAQGRTEGKNEGKTRAFIQLILAKMQKINPFDQPAVELRKELAKKILKK
jgi:flagellar biosynthesis/type III secretory pathway protein FliH